MSTPLRRTRSLAWVRSLLPLALAGASAAPRADMADARRQMGEKFNLRAFHDFIWRNGNVPLALHRWESLGDGEEIVRVDSMRRPPRR